MSVRKALEAKLLQSIGSRVGSDVSVIGFLESAATGTIKEETDGTVEVRVTVSPAQAEGYASKIVEYACTICVNLDLEDDPTQAAFDEVGGIIENMLLVWNDSANLSSTVAEIQPDGLTVCGVMADGGSDSLDLTRENPRISTVYKLAVKGIINE